MRSGGSSSQRYFKALNVSDEIDNPLIALGNVGCHTPPDDLADLITLGPGSLYTSLITNLLVQGVPEALASARGTRIYIANLMTQANESLHLTAAEHIERIYAHARQPVFDYALVNTAPVSAAVRERYAAEDAEVIEADVERIEAMGIRCITGDFAAEGDVLRHAADRVAATVLRTVLDARAGDLPG